ncbi:MAG TPA: hypothetical protein VF119_03690 [Candidatus Limnocylindrales bacterium]
MTRSRSDRPGDDDQPSGTGGFLGQVGLFESANGLPHGPVAIVLAIAVAIVIVPLTRLARMLLRR